MCVARRRVEVFALRGDDKVLGLDELGALAVKVCIPPDLLERLTNKWQVKKHLVKIRKIFRHILSDLVVHEVTNATCLILGRLVRLTNDCGLDRATGWIKLGNGAGIELRSSFSDQRMDDNAQATGCSFIFSLCQTAIRVKCLEPAFVTLFPLRPS